MGIAGGVPTVHIERVVDVLPGGLDRLRIEARVEGHRNVDRLAGEWHSGEMRFAGKGEALFAAFADDTVVAVGGITADPAQPDALRMRRFYVATGFRRRGIARRLVGRLLDRPETAGRSITVNAAAGSEAFWQSLGFIADRREGHTHVLPARSAVRLPRVKRGADGGAAARRRPARA